MDQDNNELFIKYILISMKYFNECRVPKLGKSNDLKRGQPRDHEIVMTC